jgi:hypothetical protein
MNNYIVKVKNKDLYFNADEMEGPYICNTPMLMDKEQAESVIKYCHELYDFDNFDTKYTPEDLEIRQVTVTINE